MPTAVTNIKHGNEDGSVTWVEAGDDVGSLPSEVLDELRMQGAITDDVTDEDRDRIAELEAEIAALRDELTRGQTPIQSTSLNDLSGEETTTSEFGGEEAGDAGDDNTSSGGTGSFSDT